MDLHQAKMIKRHRWLFITVAIILILLEIAGNLPNVTNPFSGLELATWDTFFRLRGQRPPDNQVVIVAIDDASLNWLHEPWPWPRSELAEIVNW